MKKPRQKHAASFKAKVAIAALREQETAAEIARRHGLHVNVVYKWKQHLVEHVETLFEPRVRVAAAVA